MGQSGSASGFSGSIPNTSHNYLHFGLFLYFFADLTPRLNQQGGE
jgi:hypothetical protein